MRKLIITAASIAALAVIPAASMASAPDGHFNFKANGASANASSIGEQSSAISQNGQFVSGQDNSSASIRRRLPARVPCSFRLPSATSRR